MKLCKKCNKTKALSDFTKNKREKDGYRRVCRNCSATYERERYKNGPAVRSVQAAGQESRQHRNRMYAHNYLSTHPCVDCGESDIIVLEFDHVRGKKEYNVSELVAHCYSVKKIQKEIDKCEVRCCNCHRRKTMKQLGWYSKNNPVQTQKKAKILKNIRKDMVLGIRGSQVKGSKLVESQVSEIKILLKKGETPTEIARQFGMCVKSICNINNGKSWKHVR